MRWFSGKKVYVYACRMPGKLLAPLVDRQIFPTFLFWVLYSAPLVITSFLGHHNSTEMNWVNFETGMRSVQCSSMQARKCPTPRRYEWDNFVNSWLESFDMNWLSLNDTLWRASRVYHLYFVVKLVQWMFGKRQFSKLHTDSNPQFLFHCHLNATPLPGCVIRIPTD